MWVAISSLIQLIYLIIQNKFEKDKELKKKKEDLHVEAYNAIKEHNVSRTNVLLNKLRQQ